MEKQLQNFSDIRYHNTVLRAVHDFKCVCPGN
jgi:hypothetical protein